MLPASVVIPTHNERENLDYLVYAIVILEQQLRILLVGDNLPDGTGKVGDKLATMFPSVQVLHLWVLVLLMVLTRLPFIQLGYGYDSDAWHIAEAGWHWRAQGQYVFSRPPGYPLMEGLVALTPPGAWWITNLITVAAGALIVVLFYRLSRYGLLQRPFWFGLLLLATPVCWITSSETMDYVYALLWILGSYHALLARRVWLSALLLGIACGFRPSSGIFIMPSIVMLVLQKYNWRSVLGYMLTFAVSGIAAYSPVLLTYGLDVLPGFALRFSPLQIGYNAVQGFGVIGTITVVAAVLIALLRVGWSDLATWLRRPEIAYAVTAIAVVTVLFIIIPDDSAYLLPAVPFLLLLLDRLTKSSTWVAPSLVILMLLSAIVSPQFWLRDSVNGMKWSNRLVVQPGVVVQDWLDRQRQIDFAYAVLQADVPCGSVVIVGWSLPSIRYIRELSHVEKQCPSSQPIRYVHLLTKPEVGEMVRTGIPVFWAGRASRYSEQIYGFQLADLPGIVYLDVGVAP